MRVQGYTLIDLLSAISLMALVACLTLGLTAKQLELYHLHHDALLLRNTLEHAQSTALLSGTAVPIAYTNHDLTLHIGAVQEKYRLSDTLIITFAGFPATKQKTIVLTQSGLTDFQNGTFTLTSKSGYQKQIIINQAGRFYVKTCGT